MSVSVRGVWAIPPPDFDESSTILLAIRRVLHSVGHVSHKGSTRDTTENALECSRGTTTNTAVRADELDPVSRFTLVHQVVVQNHVRTARQLTSRSSLGHFLDADALVIAERAETILDLQGSSLFVRLRCDRGSGREVRGGGRGIAVFAVVELTFVGRVMDRLEHLRTNKGAARDDTLERDHVAKVGGAEGPRANVVIAKGTMKTDAVSFAFDIMLVDIMYLLYDIEKCVVKSGKKLYGLLEQAVRKVASIVA